MGIIWNKNVILITLLIFFQSHFHTTRFWKVLDWHIQIIPILFILSKMFTNFYFCNLTIYCKLNHIEVSVQCYHSKQWQVRELNYQISYNYQICFPSKIKFLFKFSLNFNSLYWQIRVRDRVLFGSGSLGHGAIF